jgi:hypothetical protein
MSGNSDTVNGTGTLVDLANLQVPLEGVFLASALSIFEDVDASERRFTASVAVDSITGPTYLRNE